MTTLSPPLEPAQYSRDKSDVGSEVREKVYGNWKLNRERAKWMEDTIPYGDMMVLYNGELGEVYVGDGHVHVSDSLYRTHPIMVLREYVLESLVSLSQGGVVAGLECVKDHTVRKVDG